MSQVAITDHEFIQFQRFIYEAAGITLSPAKKALVAGRLAKRVDSCKAGSYGNYFRLLASGTRPEEVQLAVDLLTTNETYFFREPKHFAVLRELVATERQAARPFRVWSAASSTGEEAYSVAMVLAEGLPAGNWEVVGSDISRRVLERARLGHYPMERARHIPPPMLKRYCLKGVGKHSGTLLVSRELRSQVRFEPVNLNAPLPSLGPFDVVFLRNVMIYFNEETKRQVIGRVLKQIKPAGHLLVGHSESLHGLTDGVKAVSPAVYQKT